MIRKIKKVLRTFGLELTRFNPGTSDLAVLKRSLDFFQIDLVIDVGANIGQFGMLLKDVGYKNAIISFEPMAEAFKKLNLTSEKYKNWTAYNYGVGESNGEQVINVSKNSFSSSILNVTSLSTNAEPLSDAKGKERIKIVSLDSFLDKRLINFKSIYLKIDVQGYELKVLEGSKELLSNFTVVQLEMSFVPLYDGGPLFKEIISWMETAGFELYSILPEFRDMRSGRMLQADGVFVNKNSSKRFS